MSTEAPKAGFTEITDKQYTRTSKKTYAKNWEDLNLKFETLQKNRDADVEVIRRQADSMKAAEEKSYFLMRVNDEVIQQNNQMRVRIATLEQLIANLGVAVRAVGDTMISSVFPMQSVDVETEEGDQGVDQPAATDAAEGSGLRSQEWSDVPASSAGPSGSARDVSLHRGTTDEENHVDPVQLYRDLQEH